MAARRILSLSSAYIVSVALLSAHFEPLTFPGFLLSIPPPMLSLNWGHNCEVLSQRIGRLTILSGNASNLLMRKLQHPPGIDSEPPSTSRNANANNSILTPSLLTYLSVIRVSHLLKKVVANIVKLITMKRQIIFLLRSHTDVMFIHF